MVLLNCLLGGCARAASQGGVGLADRGLALIDTMRRLGVQPDATSYNILVATAANAAVGHAAGDAAGERRLPAAAAVMKGLQVGTGSKKGG